MSDFVLWEIDLPDLIPILGSKPANKERNISEIPRKQMLKSNV